jgi:hypothetical protein
MTRNTPTSVFPKTSSIGHLLSATAKLATTIVHEQVATAGQHSRGGNQENDRGRVETKCRYRNITGLCNGCNDAPGAGSWFGRLVTNHSPQRPGSIPGQSMLDLWWWTMAVDQGLLHVLGFHPSLSFHQCSTFIHHGQYVKLAPDGVVKQHGAERCICGTVGTATLHRPPTALQPEAEMHWTSVNYRTTLACGHAVADRTKPDECHSFG